MYNVIWYCNILSSCAFIVFFLVRIIHIMPRQMSVNNSVALVQCMITSFIVCNDESSLGRAVLFIRLVGHLSSSWRSAFIIFFHLFHFLVNHLLLSSLPTVVQIQPRTNPKQILTFQASPFVYDSFWTKFKMEGATPN